MAILLRNSVCLLILLQLLTIDAFTIEKVKQDEEEQNAGHLVQSTEARSSEAVFDQIIRSNRAVKGIQKLSLFEADISLVEQPEGIDTPVSNVFDPLLVKKRSLRRSLEYLWINRVIPYEITEEVESGITEIEEAMNQIEKQSCLNFIKRTDQKNWIRFENKGACFSSVGRSFWREGFQTISLSNACLNSPGTIIHEILHSLGFWHEQSRPDRDAYVEVMWENIADGEDHNFAKYSRGESDDFSQNYDLGSIMHYGRLSFSKNGKPTIQAIDNPNQKLGQRDKLSVEDVIQLNKLYRCEDVGKAYTSWSSWSPCDDNCRKKRQRFCSNYDKGRCPEASLFGVHSEYGECTEAECYKPITGHWGRWSSWNDCNQKCGHGRKTRSRQCDDPKPKNGGVSCEGEKIQTSKCYLKPCGLSEDDCQFDEQEMCFWKDKSEPNYKWQRITGKTPSGGTGPNTDHSTRQTTQDGYYMYTEASAPAQTGNRASLVSKAFTRTKHRCITFFYTMHGIGIGALRVYKVIEGTGEEFKLWEKFGSQGSDWKEAQVDFSSKFAYRIKFESERGATFQGDIGLDDIHFRESECSAEQHKQPVTMPMLKDSTTTTTTSTTTTPPPTIDTLSAICGIKIQPLGCFADIPSEPSMDIMLDSHRGGNAHFHGVFIDWKNYGNSLKLLLCDCLHRAKDHGMNYVGLQFYGECWGSREPTYNRYGISTRCLDSNFKTCYHKNKLDICIGKGMTNYVYEIL